jgi:serine/threonine protein kinase/Tfp pilus assembly protein PilF
MLRMSLSAGTRLGPYEILAPIGAGGMGEVYRAHDMRLQRDVALKILPAAFASDPDRVRRFEREGRAAAALNHPNIVAIYDVGSQDGVFYVVIELLEGDTLRERLAGPALPVRKAIDYCIQIARGLAAAQAKGVTHRDLKPENLFLTKDGLVKILDFGLARYSGARPEAVRPTDLATETIETDPGKVLGTAGYMSPEQVRGRVADARSDLFSLGVVLYEMVSGRRAFAGESSVEVMNAILKEEPPELDAAVPPSLDRIIRRCLEKNPDERFQTGLDLAFALESIPGSAERKAQQQAPSATTDQLSLAVLPFIFLSPVEGKESLSLGFADALITSLGSLRNFLVLPTSAILKYPGGTDPTSVSHDLHVHYVLQGSIQKLGSRWRVTLQLHDAEMSRTVFASKYDFNLEDVFEIQDQICQRVADSLSGEFRSGAPKMRDRYSKDPYAYDEYLRGLKSSFSDTPEIMEEAIQHLSQAAERDPDFALAHAALARVLVEKHRIFDPRRSTGERAEYHAQRALALDPDLPEGHLARAYVLWSQIKKYQGREAIGELLKARSLHPNLESVHDQLGLICCHYGRMTESLEAFERARQMNPENMYAHWAGLAYLWLGDLDHAIREYEEWMRKSPGSKYALWLRPQPALLSGDVKTAGKYLREALAIAPEEPLYISLQGILHAVQGEDEPALNCVRRACESPHSFGHDHHTYYQLGCIYSVLGETSKALGWINRAVENGFPCWPFFRFDPTLERLRALPEFQAQVEELRKQSGWIPLLASADPVGRGPIQLKDETSGGTRQY